MAAIVPFPALRPSPAVASRVAAVPYDVVNTEEARALATDPLSFLHVSRAEIDLPPGTSLYSDEVYARATANFVTLRRNAPLVMDEMAGVYIYRLRMGAHTQTGIAGTFSIDEYQQGTIKKHEKTRQDKEDDRTRHIIALRAQTGPVFLTYRAAMTIDAVVARATSAAPLYDFAAADGVHHTLWRLEPADADSLTTKMADVDALYIADGHHRAASAARARQTLRDRGEPTSDTFLAVAFPGDQLQVMAYNRVVRDLAGHTGQSFLAAVRGVCDVTEGSGAPRGRGHVSMYLDGRWYSIALNPAFAPGGATAGKPVEREPADGLDVSRLQHQVIEPLLKIGDVRTDTRIDFVGGARGTTELERLVDSGRAAVAFSMYPVAVDDLMAIADAGGIMPPKSTWFEPKLRDGLLSHLI
jgi:uncharacterized protein (DUF1015 family)